MRTTKELNMTRDLKFGVEIEFINRECVADVIRIAESKGVVVKELRYTHDVTNGFWKIVTDSSCGMEIVSPVLYGMEGIEEVKKVCEALNEAGAKVNVNCGVHVHHDLKGIGAEQLKNVYRFYDKYIKAIDSMMPNSRRGNNNCYCQDTPLYVMNYLDECNTFDDILEIVADISSKRYRKINLVSARKYGTIEFRQHSGSTDGEKITNWIILTNLILQRAEGKAVKPVTEARKRKWAESDVEMMYDFYMELGISGTALAKYVRSRRKALKND